MASPMLQDPGVKKDRVKKTKFDESLLMDLGFNSFYRELLMSADAGLLGGNVRGRLFNDFGFTQAETFFRDPQVSAAFNACALPILAKKPRFIPNSDDQKSHDLADFFNWTLTKFNGSTVQLMYDMLTAKYFGNAKIEKRLGLMESGKYKLNYYYRSFHKKRTGLWDFVYDEETNTEVIGIRSLVDPDRTNVYSLDKFLRVSDLMLDDNPNGQGDYEKIAKFVTAKNEILIFMLALGAKQSNSKFVVLKTQAGTVNAEAELKRILKRIKQGLGIALPKGFDCEVTDFKTDNVQWFIDILKWLDSQIALAIIGNSTSINESTGPGTNAQSEVHAKFGTQPVIDLWTLLISQVFIEQYMKPLIALNFDPAVYTEDFYPMVSMVENKRVNKAELVAWLKAAQEAEIMDFKTETDLNYAREELELPKNDELLELANQKAKNENMDEADRQIVEMINKISAYGVTKEEIIRELQVILDDTINGTDTEPPAEPEAVPEENPPKKPGKKKAAKPELVPA